MIRVDSLKYRFLSAFYMHTIWPTARMCNVKFADYLDELGAYCAGGEL